MPERQPPKTPPWALVRPRLLGAIDAAAPPLVVLRAGAGYGKTVLATQWLATRTSAVWWELDAAEAELPGDRDVVIEGYRPGRAVADRLLCSLLDRLSTNKRVLLLSRAEPTLNLGRMRIEGRVAEFGASDLAFTREELQALLHSAGSDPDEEEVELLLARTLGWPAAVQLLRSAGEGASFDGASEPVARYLEAEIWRPLRRQQKEFALNTSILEELQPRWCDLLLGKGGSAKLLRELRNIESWLLPPRKVGEGFRHHPLVREFLLSRLDETPGNRRELELRAARVLRENHRTVEAVAHAIAAEEWELAIECLRSGADRAFREGNPALLREQLACFPAEYRDRPELLRIEGYLHWAAGDLDVAGVKATAALASPDPNLKADALILQAAVRYSRGDLEGELESLREAIGLEPSDSFVGGKGWYALGSLHYRAGRYAAAEEALLRAASLSHSGEPVHVAVTNLLALLPLARGTPRNAIAGLVRAIDANRKLGNRRGEAIASYHLAIALNQAGMHQRALNTLAEAARLSKELGLVHLAALIAREEADAHRDLASGEAYDLYQTVIDELKSLNAAAGLLHAYHGLAVLHRRAGDREAARRAAEKALLHEGSGDPAFVTLIRLHLALVSGASDEQLVERALTADHLYYRVLGYLYALASSQVARRQLARSALELIQNEGLEHLLREETELSAPLLTPKVGNRSDLRRVEGQQRFRLNLLGGLTLVGPDGESVRLRPQALRLLAYLALRRGATVDAEHLIDALWPDRGQEMRPTMQTLVWLVRRTLMERVIVSHSSGYDFDPDGLIRVDAEEFRRAVDRSSLEEAVGLYRGELLPGIEWADLERRHLENRYLQVLEGLAEVYYEEGRLNAASELLEKIVQIDPFAENTYRKLIEWYRLAGHEDVARRFRRELALRLEGELGIPAD